MIISILSIIFCIELYIIFLISKKVEFYNPLIFFLVLPIFYANSLFLDYLIFGQDFVQVNAISVSPLYVSDINYSLIMFFTLLYVIGVFISFKKRSVSFEELKERTKSHTDYFEKHNSFTLLKFFFILICSIYIINESLQLYGLDRYNVRMVGGPIRTLMLMGAFSFLCFTLMFKWKYKLLNFIILTILLFYSIVSFQRETILFLSFALILNLEPKKISLNHILIGILTLVFLTYYKTLVFYFNIYVRNEDMINFIMIPIRFVNIDPASSLLLLSDYLDNNSIYGSYYGSYFINTAAQFLRMFTDNIDWLSLSEFTQQYYTRGEMGTAFSMILESFLNFWYLGPFIIGYFITYLFYETEKVAGIYYKLHYFIFFIFIVKIVRTELAVVLKLYIFPAFIAYLIFVSVSNIKFLKK